MRFFLFSNKASIPEISSTNNEEITIFAFGGFGHKDVPGEAPRTISTVERLSASGNSWELVTSMNEARAFFGSCALDQQYIFVFGGYHCSTLSTFNHSGKRKSVWFWPRPPLSAQEHLNFVILITGYHWLVLTIVPSATTLRIFKISVKCLAATWLCAG